MLVCGQVMTVTVAEQVIPEIFWRHCNFKTYKDADFSAQDVTPKDRTNAQALAKAGEVYWTGSNPPNICVATTELSECMLSHEMILHAGGVHTVCSTSYTGVPHETCKASHTRWQLQTQPIACIGNFIMCTLCHQR